MSALAGALSFGRFVAGIPRFLRHETSVEEASDIIRRQMDRREATFVELLKHAVYGYPRSPYRRLLEIAGCEIGDAEALVRHKGLEGALRDLRRAGVFVTFEEFKGREPIVRSGRTIDARPEDFDNPLLGGAVRRPTGGTTGAPTTIRKSLEDLAEKAPVHVLGYTAHGLWHAPTATLREGLTGLGPALIDARIDHVHERWFAPLLDRGTARSVGSGLMLRVIGAACRLGGVRFALPEPLPYDEFDTVAEWATERARAQGRSVVRTNASHALRVASAALDRGLDLTGVTFSGGGDPATPGKVSRISQAGASWVPVYVMSETGRIGIGCANPTDGSDVHLLDHYIALIAHPRIVPGTDVEIESFHFTSLRFYSPKIMLNTESDDYGVIEERSCGCPLEEVGFARHVREIFSFRKLTSGGVTLVGSRMLRVLEEVLPARFGGSATDYQLVEEEDEEGYTRLSLVVSPRIDVPDEPRLVETVLAELGDDRLSASVRSIWRQIGTLRVVRREPEATGRGKIIPLARGGSDGRT